MILRIRDWDKHFENSRTREMKKLNWVPIPNGHDGDGYTDLLDHERGPSHYAAWVVMVQVASRCRVRGTLLRDGGQPYDSASLARRTRMPRELFDDAIPRLLKIGWLEVIDSQGDAIEGVAVGCQDVATAPHPNASVWQQPITERMERTERTERNGTEEAEPDRAVPFLENEPEEIAAARQRTVKPLPAGPLREGIFSGIDESDLKNVGVLREWHARQLSAVRPAVGNTEADLLLVIAAGTYAARYPPRKLKSNRVAIWVDIVSNRRWESVLHRVPEAARQLAQHLEETEAAHAATA